MNQGEGQGGAKVGLEAHKRPLVELLLLSSRPLLMSPPRDLMGLSASTSKHHHLCLGHAVTSSPLSCLLSQLLQGSLHRAVSDLPQSKSDEASLWGAILESLRSCLVSLSLASYQTLHLDSRHTGMGRCCCTCLEISCFPSSRG